MKRKSTILRLFALLALMVPWTLQAQNARVSEYEGTATTATYSSIAGTSGATAWTPGSYVDVSMPFAMSFGESQVTAGSTLRVYPDGSASFTALADSRIAPLYYGSGYTTTATSIYTRATAQQVVVEWRKVVSGSNSYSFQLKLYPTGDIEFCYGPMTISSSIDVLVGLMSSATDIFRVGGADNTNDWSGITRYTTGLTTRTLSSTYYPAFSTATGQGMVYTFTQPACVKPNTLAAESTGDGAVLTWDSRSTNFQIKYSTDANFDPATEGTQTTSTTTTKTLTGLTPFTTYYWYVRAVCSGTPSAWSEMGTFMPGTVVNMGDVTSLTTCSAMIYDDGGPDESYGANADYTLTINPATSGKRIRLTGSYNTESCCDEISIYDGTDATGTLLGTFAGEGVLDIAGELGPLTIVLTSDGSVQNDGFALMATCENIPTCPNPTLVSATADGVVTWTASNNATSYELAIGTTSGTPTQATVTGLTATTYTIPGLATTTTYYVYLRAVCSATNETTEWIGPLSFTTPNCMGTCTYSIAMVDSYGDGWNGASIDLYVNGALTESYTIPSGGSEANASYTSCPGDYLEFRWTSGSYDSEASFTLTKYNGTENYSGSSLSGGAAFLSEYACGVEPSCPKPQITFVTSEAMVTWTASSNATSFDIKWGATGFDPATEGTLVSNLTGTAYTITGWESNTTYDVYLRAHCSATSETTDWTVAYTFTTSCAPIALPFSEDFSSYSTPTYPYSGPATIPTCWDYISNGTNTEATTGSSYYGTVASYSSTSSYASMVANDKYFAIPSYGPSSTYAAARGSQKILVLPKFTSPINALSIYFDYKMSNASYGIFELGYYHNGTFTSLKTITRYSATTHFEQIMGSLSGINDAPAGARIALKWYQTSGSSVYYVGIDNIEVEVTPTCFKPTWNGSPVVTATSATLEWTGNASQYELLIGPSGFNPLTEGRTVLVTGSSTTLDYLSAATNYDVYVRGVCSATDYSAWSNVISFSTSRYPCISYGTPGPEETVTIGNGTTNLTYVPGYSLYDYSYTQQIYTAEEIGGAGIINSIALNISGVKPRLVDIYLVETSKSVFANTSDWVAVTDADKVFTGNIGNATGWETYTLTTPFNYSGTGNLVVVVDNNNGSYSSGLGALGGSGYTNMVLYKYQDNNNIDPANPPSGTLYSSRNNLRLGIQYASCNTGRCTPPEVAIALSDAEYAATLTFTNMNEDVTTPTYGIIWGPQGFNPRTSGTSVSPITSNTYTISNLTQLTSYDVYAYAICGSGDVDTVVYNFVTPFIPNCKMPNTIAASNITYNTAELTWNQPGDMPQTWTIRYATADFDPATAAATDYTELLVGGNPAPSALLTGLVAGTTYYVYIKATCSTSPLDESPWSAVTTLNPAFTFSTQTCNVPAAVTASNVTNITADIAWTGNAAAYTLKYGLAGFDPETAGTEVACTTNSAQLTGLNQFATYHVYVKSNCTATDVSGWSDVCSFRTTCPDGGSVDVNGTTASTNYSLPVNTYFNYSYTQQIITAEEMAGPTNIQGVSLQYDYSGALDPTKYDVTIYMGVTEQSSFASSAAFVDPATLTQVWHGTFNVEQGWNDFVFDTPFEYSGAGNVVIAFHDNVTGYNSSSHKFNTESTSSAMALAYYSDSYNPDPTSASTLSAYSGSKTTYSYRNVMKLIAACNTDVTCFAPIVSAPVVAPNNNVALTWTSRTDLLPVVNNFELKYGLAGFDPDNSGTLVPNLNNVFNYNITAALDADADYDVYVRTVCGGDSYSPWAKVSFHTYPSCWAPSALAVTATTQTSATLSWTENTPTAATRWEVVYGLPGFDPDRATPIETTNNSAFEVTGLNHTTRYEFYVRAVCSATDHSPWSNVAIGTTQCGIWQYADMPLVEDFDGVTGTTSSTINNHVLPNCWNYINTSTTTSGTSTTGYPGYPIAYNGASYSHSGNNHMRFYTYTTAAYGDQYAILPQFGFNLDTVIVGLYARESSTTATYVGNIEVGVMTDPTDASTFVAVGSVLPTTTSYDYFEVDFSEYTGTGRYIALKAIKPTTGYNIVYVDDLTVKLREKVNTLADAGQNIVACNEFIMPDTTNGGYHGNLNATYVVRPAEAGKVAHLTGSYNLENGYDFLNVYRGAANANNLIGRYTGTGEIDYVTNSNLWADSGYFTLVFTTDGDNAFAYDGFKLLVSCECPQPAADIIAETEEANGTYTWRNGETYNNNVVRTGLTYDVTATGETSADLQKEVNYTYVNVAGCDSISYSLNLTVHPTYNLTYNAEICERDVFAFYGQEFNATGTYTVALTSQYGADSTGILNLQVNPAPTAGIYYNNREVTTIDAFCDNADLSLLARSNNTSATFKWEDESTEEARVVNPHETNIYSVVATEPAHGCTSLPASVTVTTTPVPELTISGDAEICFGESTTLTLTDANNVDAAYRWSTGATTASITVNPTETTTYTVTATTNNTSACTATASIEVVVNQLPVVTATASVGEICRDSVVTLTATEVDGYSYSWNTGAATAVATTAAANTGVYTVTVTDQNGCVNEFSTSTVTVYPSYELTDELSVCYTNNPYTWGEQTITANGSYDQNFTIAHGCDSLVHLTFTFEEMGIENTNREVCEGTSVTWGSETIIASETTVLTYIDNSGDCPVQKNLYLTVNYPAATAIENTVCDSYTWAVSGETYTESGAYPYTLATTKGCDSVVTLNLTVNYQNTGVETVTACDSYIWDLNGVSYTTTTNEPTFTLQNQWGCDSVVTLDLTVNYRSYHEDFHCVRDANNFTWIDGSTYSLNVNVDDGIEYVTGQNDAGCNEIAQLHLVLNPVINVLNWVTIDTCDEFEIPNAVTFADENDCEGTVEPLYIAESGDYEIRIRPDATVATQDQTYRVHLTINQSSHHTTVVTACLPYEWLVNVGTEEAPQMYSVATITEEMVAGASVYNMSYEMPQQYSNGCSSIEVLRLTPKYPTVETTDAVICQNGTWTAPNNVVYYGSTLSTEEVNVLTWDNTELNTDGCPLTKKVNLTVNPVYNVIANETICENEFVFNETTGEYEYTVNDANHADADAIVLTIPGALNEVVYNNTVVANWQTALGCDSIVTISYTVNPITTTTDIQTVCYSDNYVWDANGRTYNEAGAYVDTVVEADNSGCMLYNVLNLTVLGTFVKEDTVNVCTSYEGPDGETYRETKTFDVPYEGAFDATQYCDAITRRTYNVLQNTLTEHFVLTNADYTWMNGVTYTENVSNVYYDAPVLGGGCDDVHLLQLTMVDPIVICENALPYTVSHGNSTFVIPADAADNGTIGNGDDTILYFTILRNTAKTVTQTACDSYTWATGNGETYTTSGNYEWTTTNVAGCDSVVTLALTVNVSNAETVTEVACDSYTWTTGNGETYTTSGNYEWTTTNVAGCDSVVTLALTINVNEGVELSETACDTYTWNRTNIAYTVSGDYSVNYTDANGCVGDSVLHLTINPSYETNSEMVVNEAGSYTYLGVMYTAPYDGTIDHTFQSINGCDSIDHLHLIIPVVDNIVEINVEACGSYTWEAPDGTGHTYEWIPMSERQSHGMAMYKDVTANQYIYTYPTDTTFDANGAMTAVRVLHLNLLEATYSTETLNIPASLGTYTIDGDPDDVTITFNLDSVGTPIVRTLGVGSVAYCNDYRTYTINIIDNYDTTEVFACADEASYTWNEVDYTIGTPGHTFWFSQVENAGTMNELVHVLKVNQRAVNATTTPVTACDTYTWTDGDGQTYTTSGTYVYNYTDDNQCAASKTLTLTVNYNSNTAYTDVACDTYTWTRNNQTYTATGDYTYGYTNTAGCASTDTLHLTININSNQTFTEAACNSYVWATAEGGDGLTYTTSGTYTYNYNNAENGCPSVNTLNLTINLPTNTAETLEACDSIEWNGTMYYASGDYEYDYTSTAGCASTDTLHLTVNAATHNAETMVQCDSYEWNGTTYTASGEYTYSYSNVAGCASVDTLYLTINVNTSTINDVVTACDEYTWAVNDRLYNASGSYTARTTDVNGCATTNTLELTINHSSSYDSILYVSDGSYRYTYQDQHQELFGEGVYNLVEMYTNAAGCDSTLNITLKIGTALLGIDNVVACREYTWRNGETYVYIDAAERAANPNTDNVAPLYKTSTGTYIYYNPTYTVVRENNFDSIYMLALTLNESYQGYFETTVNVSEGSYNYVNADFGINTVLSFADAAAEMHNFVNTDSIYDVEFVNPEYCGGVMTVTLHLVNNYQEVTEDVADICVSQDSYTWRGHTISTATTDYDNAHTYYIYDDINAEGIIEYITVNQHPISYTTERRTACDSYEWYGNVYTESTTNATEYLPAGTVVDGEPLICDRVATLILVINHNTNTTYDVPACEEYTWTAADGGNGETYTESGVYTYDYLTAQGCPSTNTLNLTINHNTNTEFTVDACDSYTWTAEEGGNGTVYTTASPAEGYTFDYLTLEGCPSTNTLHLTIRNNSNETFTETACDTYTWLAADGGDGETYTTSGVYTYEYEAENGCPSVNTLNLTINANSSTEYTLSACDSYTWHGTEYTASGDYTFDYADANNCASEDVLHLTINSSTLNVTNAVECNSYTWTHSDNTTADITVSGEYEYNYVDGNGCTVTDSLYLTIGSGRAFDRVYVTNCGPYTWIVEGEEVAVLDESVETSTTVVNPVTGCDSTIFLYLTINPQVVTEETICDNETYTWTVNNETYNVAGTYDVNVTDDNGNCVSSERLVLTVNATDETNLTDQICLGNDYNANGFVIAASELAEAGVYNFVDHRTTAQGCEHTYNLTLTVGDVINNPVEAVACDSYTWNAGDGETYEFTASGIYTSDAYSNAAGCTTVDVLTLTINQNAGTEYTETVCDSYMWNGTTYAESGDYTYDYTDGNGCASTDVLHLTVNNSMVETITKVVCDSYEWSDGDGETYYNDTVVTYNTTTATGCNLTKVLVLDVNKNSSTEYTVTACDSYTWNDIEYTESGDYTFDYEDVNGCQSTDVLHLTVNENSNTASVATACDEYIWHGQTYTASGDYTYNYVNERGCASTDTLYLTVNYNTNSGETVTTCYSYTWHDVNYTQSGTYYHHYTTAEGCASVDTLYLTANHVSVFNEIVTACDSYTWELNGETYTESGAYVESLEAANGCDSIITLRLTINSSEHNVETATACDSYTWNGQTYTATGDYVYNYTSNNGCASTDTLHLTVNSSTTATETATACNYYAWNGNVYTESGSYTTTLQTANGCDSVVTLNLTLGTVVNSTVTATACNSYTWNGQTYTASGAYPHTYSGVAGCDSIVTLILTINQPKTTTLAITACDSYTWNGQTYTTSGDRTHTYTAINGCDSVVTLSLTINQSVATTISATACDSYTWNGATYTTSNSYTQNFTTVAGCDSVVTLNLTITPAIQTTVYQTSCNSYTWNGQTYTTSGNYTHTYTSASGCDSTVTLNLTVTPSINMTTAITACDSYTWNGTAYTTSGAYQHTYTAYDGCDSVVTLILTINSSVAGTTSATACDSYTWNGNEYTTSGIYTHTYTAANGCDSVVTMTLTVNNSTSGVDEQTACNSYTWIDGETYTSSTDNPTYTLTGSNGCDSVVTLNLTINNSYDIIDAIAACDGFIWIDNVNYTESTNTPTVTLTAANGCDSVITLHLTINHSVEVYDTIDLLQTDLPYDYNGNTITAAGDYVFNGTTVNGCDSTVYLHVNVTYVGIDVASILNEVKIYPNPTHGRVTVTADNVIKIEVLDIVGRTVATFKDTNTFDISNLVEGAYTLRITLPEGVTVRKVVRK